MNERYKKIFLYICILVPFIGYSIFYYSNMIKNAPFRFADFESIEFSFGPPDHMVNKFDSKTAIYQYLDGRDSLIVDTLRMKKDELLYLHRKATEYGFWNFPDDMTSASQGDTTDDSKVRFYLKFIYKEKSKEMVFDSDFSGNAKLYEAAKTMVTETQRIINDAEDRQQ